MSPHDRHIVMRGPELAEAGKRLALEFEGRYMDLDARLDRLHGRLDELEALTHSLLVLLEAVAAQEGAERLSKGLLHLRRRHKLP